MLGSLNDGGEKPRAIDLNGNGGQRFLIESQAERGDGQLQHGEWVSYVPL